MQCILRLTIFPLIVVLFFNSFALVSNESKAYAIAAPSWSIKGNVDTIHGFSSGISCLSYLFCMAVDQTGYSQVYSSSGWSKPIEADPGNAINSVSCVALDTCFAVDDRGSVLEYSSSIWQPPVNVSGGVSATAISCVSQTFCAIATASGNLLVFNGSQVTKSGSNGGNFINAVSCISISFCAAGDVTGNLLLYKSGSFNLIQGSEPGTPITSISCASSTFCLLGDDLGNALSYNGTNITILKNVDNQNTLTSISCVSISFCAIVDSNGNVLNYENNGFTLAKSIDASQIIAGVSCISTSFCMAVDVNGNSLTFSGTWGPPVLFDPVTGYPSSVSCVSVQACVIVDHYGNSLNYAGGIFSSPSKIDGTNFITGISCPIARFCLAVDNSGNSIFFSNSVWENPTTVDNFSNISSTSCSSSSFCVAIDRSGHEVTYSSGSWSQPKQIDSTLNSLESISCPSTSFCMAVDSNGNAIEYNGSWLSSVNIDSTNFLTSISCPSTSFCMAVDSNGNAIEYNGSWLSPVNIDSTNNLTSISCGSETFCLAVDSVGNAALFTELIPTINSVSPALGPISGGTNVIISGLNFSGTTQVAFGSVSAQSFQVISSTEIEAVSPAASVPGLVQISVITPIGTSFSNQNSGFLYETQQSYTPIVPTRVCDTRFGASTNQCNIYNQGLLRGGSSINITVAGINSIPSSISTVVINITATNTTSSSYLTIWPTGTARPLASNLNWIPGQTISNLTQVAVGASGQISIFNAYGQANVIADVEGYYQNSAPGYGGFIPITPVRICDTRITSFQNQCNKTANFLGPNSSRTISVVGPASLPTAGVSAIAINVTVIGPSAQSSYLTIFPTGANQPLASNVNFTEGEVIADYDIVELGSNGEITVYNYSGNLNMTIDVYGYYSAAGATNPGMYFNSTYPMRICDTRNGARANQCNSNNSSTLAPNSSISASGYVGSIPSSATVLVANVTATNTTYWSYLTIYPSNLTGVPLASNLNWISSSVSIANEDLIGLSQAGMTLGKFTIYNAFGQVDVIVDVFGYFS